MSTTLVTFLLAALCLILLCFLVLQSMETGSASDHIGPSTAFPAAETSTTAGFAKRAVTPILIPPVTLSETFTIPSMSSSHEPLRLHWLQYFAQAEKNKQQQQSNFDAEVATGNVSKLSDAVIDRSTTQGLDAATETARGVSAIREGLDLVKPIGHGARSSALDLFQPVPLDEGIPHPLHADMRTHKRQTSRIMVMAPSVMEQRAGLVGESYYSWLIHYPTTITHSALQFKIHTEQDIRPPGPPGLPQICFSQTHLDPSWLFLQYIINQFDYLPAHLAFLSSYGQVDPTYGHDRLQHLIRWRWILLDSAEQAFMPFQFGAHSCVVLAEAGSTNDTALQDMDALHILWRAANLANDLPARLCYQPGGEFLVHRRQITRHSRAIYVSLLQAACELGWERAAVIEALWHILFGPADNLVSLQYAVSDLVLSWTDYPFYGSDKLNPYEWVLTTSELLEDEMRLPVQFRNQPMPWETAPCSVTYQVVAHRPDGAVQQSMVHTLTRNLSIALVVAAYKESLGFLQAVIPSIPKLVYRMKHPEVAGLNMSRVQASDSQLALYTSADNRLNHTRQHESRGHCSEASSYLLFIIQYYHQLPEYTIFIHGHRRSWHVRDIIQMTNNLNWTYILAHSQANAVPFYFSLNTLSVYEFDERMWTITAAYWRQIFQGQLQPHTKRPPFPYVFHCCAQFMVHRSAVLARPLSYWQHLYSWCRYTTVKPFYAGRIFEWMWPLLMAQPTVESLQPLSPCGALSTNEDCTPL